MKRRKYLVEISDHQLVISATLTRDHAHWDVDIMPPASWGMMVNSVWLLGEESKRKISWSRMTERHREDIRAELQNQLVTNRK